jgi:LmbE family N-acetylglucosaminyl deacetylase
MDPRIEPAAGGRGLGLSPLPAPIQRPPGGRVLALAAEAEELLLGAGGTIALHVEQGDPVRVAIAFDAEDAADCAPRAARRGEARAAARRIGVRDVAFLGLGRGPQADADHARAARRLVQELQAYPPDVIYAPWIGEHGDRERLARAVRAALHASRFAGTALAYEAWAPIVAERVVDVTAAFEQKLQALCAHASRLALADLLHVAAGLGAQRSAYLGRSGRQGEAFAPLCAGFPADRDELDLLARLLGAGRIACTSAS